MSPVSVSPSISPSVQSHISVTTAYNKRTFPYTVICFNTIKPTLPSNVVLFIEQALTKAYSPHD